MKKEQTKKLKERRQDPTKTRQMHANPHGRTEEKEMQMQMEIYELDKDNRNIHK